MPSPPQEGEAPEAHVPPNVLAAYRTPLYHPRTHGIPVAQLQLRSFSVRNLEFFADFCVRAAYYLSLPCTGPGPLPKKIERWTVLKSNFINKKSQENFERITLKRLITIYDGAPEVVETWLAFIRRWQYHGVGMKAHVWGWESTGKFLSCPIASPALFVLLWAQHLDKSTRQLGGKDQANHFRVLS
jgi:ribosomal protein S10